MELNFVFGCVVVFFFSQDQVPQITIEIGVIYRIKALSDFTEEKRVEEASICVSVTKKSNF